MHRALAYRLKASILVLGSPVARRRRAGGAEASLSTVRAPGGPGLPSGPQPAAAGDRTCPWLVTCPDGSWRNPPSPLPSEWTSSSCGPFPGPGRPFPPAGGMHGSPTPGPSFKMSSDPRSSPERPRGGIVRQRRLILILILRIPFAALLLAGTGALADTALPGDYDGDGRLTIEDAVAGFEGATPSPGAMTAIEAYPCYAGMFREGPEHARRYLGSLVLLEVIRRSVPDPLPNWVDIWRDVPDGMPGRSPDPRVSLRWEAIDLAEAGTDGVTLTLTLRNEAPIRAFFAVVESDGGVLRVPFKGRRELATDWLTLDGFSLEARHALGDWPLRVGDAPFLITRGRYVFTYGFEASEYAFPGAIPGGTHRLVAEGRLPRGAAAGEYMLEVLEGSEFLLLDGTVVAPTVENRGRLVIPSRIDVGHDGGVPPIDVDGESKRVLGDVELRVTDVQGFPGEVVRPKVQLRTSVPLNHLAYRVTWPSGSLECTNLPVEFVLTNPEDGRRYALYGGSGRGSGAFCLPAWRGFLPSHALEAALPGALPASGNYEGRPLEYFFPLGEWVDLAELPLRILDGPGGGAQIPLSLSLANGDFDAWVAHGLSIPPELRPYGMTWPCADPEFAGSAAKLNWTYEGLALHPGTVRVLGNDEPVDPPLPVDPGVRWALGVAEGRPGEAVDVPIWASCEDERLGALSLAVEVDAAEARVDSAVFDLVDLKTGAPRSVEVRRGQSVIPRECSDPLNPSTCSYTLPYRLSFHSYPGMDPRYSLIIIDCRPKWCVDCPIYPGRDLRRVGAVRVKIREDFLGTEIRLRHAAIPAAQILYDVDMTSGGWLGAPLEGDPHPHPAGAARDGVILVTGGALFVRGDSSADGRVNLSDALYTLNHLFRGGPDFACEDAADVDDDGSVGLTDAVFLLGHLFLGSETPPPPYPECGIDPTEDDLGCAISICD